jgi:hypothetical protein
VDARDTGQVDRHQWRDVVGLAGHHDAGHEVDVEPGELSGAEVRRNRNPQRRPSLGDPAARFKGEPEVVAQVGRGGGPQGDLRLVESRPEALEVNVERVPG